MGGVIAQAFMTKNVVHRVAMYVRSYKRMYMHMYIGTTRRWRKFQISNRGNCVVVPKYRGESTIAPDFSYAYTS